MFLAWNYCQGDAAAPGAAENLSQQSWLEAGHLFHHSEPDQFAVPLESKAGSREKQRGVHGRLWSEILLVVTSLPTIPVK